MHLIMEEFMHALKLLFIIVPTVIVGFQFFCFLTNRTNSNLK